MTDYRGLLTVLTEAGVDFVLVGGVAAVAHGSARLTQDLDVVYARDDANLGRLVEALKVLTPYLRGAPPGLPFRWDVETVRRGLNFTLTTSMGSVDLLGEITGGGGYRDLLGRSIELEIFGLRCRCFSLGQLIEVKRAARAAARPRGRRRAGGHPGRGRRRMTPTERFFFAAPADRMPAF